MSDFSIALVIIACIIAWNYDNWLDRQYPEFMSCYEKKDYIRCLPIRRE